MGQHLRVAAYRQRRVEHIRHDRGRMAALGSRLERKCMMSIVKSNPEVETVRIAPKVAWATVAILAIGVVLVIIHFVFGDTDDDALLHAGIGLILGSIPVAGAGFAAPAALQRPKVPR
jgi:hypothetical protein